MPDDANNQSNNQLGNHQQQNTNSGAQTANGKKIVFDADNGCSQSVSSRSDVSSELN